MPFFVRDLTQEGFQPVGCSEGPAGFRPVGIFGVPVKTIGFKIAAGFFVVLLMITALGIDSYRSSERLIEADVGVTDTLEVLENPAETLSRLQDAEIVQAGP